MGSTSGKGDSEETRIAAERRQRAWRSFSYASVGIEMAVATVIGWGLGFWLDRKLETAPYLMLVFLLIGVAAGFRGLIRAANSAKRDAAKHHDAPSPHSN